MCFTDRFPDIVDCRYDYLERCDSLADVRAEVTALWRETAGALPPDAADRVDREVALWIEDAILRHDVPWFSEGIKAELARDGVPVTKADVLDDYFNSHRALVTEILTDLTPEEASRRTADGVLFDDSITGNLSAYTAKDILAAWWRLKLI